MKIISRYPNLQVIRSTHSSFVLAGAEKTAAFNLETGEVHEQLDSMGQGGCGESVWSGIR